MELLITLVIVSVSIAWSHVVTILSLKVEGTIERVIAALGWFAFCQGIVLILEEFIKHAHEDQSPWGMRLSMVVAGSIISAFTVLRGHLNSKVPPQVSEPQAVPEQSPA